MNNKPTYEELEIQIKKLKNQASRTSFSEKLTRVLFDISNAVVTSTSLDELYKTIYNCLDRLMGLPNFYIALYDTESQRLCIPYFHDQYDDFSEYEAFFKPDNSLTGEVLKAGKPLLLRESSLKQRKIQGKILGTTPRIWLGVPLKKNELAFGVIAVQSYDDPDYFTESDLDILVNVSNQVALAIDRKRSLDERNMLKNYLSSIINSMPSILVGVDTSGLVTQWNFQAELETGLRDKDAIGKKLTDVFPRLYSIMDNINDSMNSGRIRTCLKHEYSTKNETRYEDIIIYPLATQEVNGVVIRMDDITDQVRLEEIMIQSEKMLSIGGLAAGMAHEINNPLAGMMQNAQVIYNRLYNNLPANEKAAEEAGISMDQIRSYMEKRQIFKKLDMINETGSRAARIINNMLAFARKSRSVFEIHDMADIMNKTIELASSDYNLKKQYDFKLIKIIKKFENPLPPVRCDKIKVQQVFLNILKNGAEAMFEAEKGSTYVPHFILRIYKKDKDICIEIEDNGPGMDERTRTRLFDPFFTTKDQGRGTGLGLSVSYFIIVKDHKGHMSVESSLGRGTRFIITLPF
jgi:PAS domain S-box-containing protein